MTTYELSKSHLLGPENNYFVAATETNIFSGTADVPSSAYFQGLKLNLKLTNLYEVTTYLTRG